MIIALYRDSAYNLILFIHILAVLVATAPSLVAPLLYRLEGQRSDGDLPALAGRLAGLPSRINVIALALAGLVGFGLISMSDEVIGFGDSWISISMLLWLAANGVLHALVLPAQQKVADGDTSAAPKVEMFHLVILALIVVMTLLMTTNP